jgi:hypothetical protein
METMNKVQPFRSDLQERKHTKTKYKKHENNTGKKFLSLIHLEVII